MSFENKNLYHLLGNDVEDDNTPQLPVREIVKNNNSTKKADVPPPSADPAKAKKKSKPTGNEGALKTKLDNKAAPGPTSTPSKHYKKPFDRHSRSNKDDSKKKIKQGWGTSTDREVEGEIEGEEDAAHDLAAEAEESSEPSVPQRSFQDYFAELEQQRKELAAPSIRKPNEGAEDKWSGEQATKKEQEAYVTATVSKKARAKVQKEKKFLEIDAIFADEKADTARGESRGARGGRGGARGGARGGRGGARGGKKPSAPAPAGSAKKPEINDKNFPSL